MLVQSLKEKRTISIIGMEKNTGKTTLLNAIIARYGSDKTLALTSIGYDGEDVDQVTNTHKPRIYVPAGTLVATAQNLLKKCDCIKEILQVYDMRTPIGDVVLFRAKSEGYIELGGPSMVKDLKRLKTEIKKIDSNAQFIIDGALSRQSMAGHRLSDASILCTGAALSGSMASVVEQTAFTLDKLKIPSCLETIKQVNDLADSHAQALLIFSGAKAETWDEKIKPSQVPEAIILKGLVTTKRLNALVAFGIFKHVKLVCEDGTRLFTDRRTLNLLSKHEIELRVLHPITILGVGLNPTAPSGNNFDAGEFLTAMKRVTDLPLIDTRTLDEFK